MLTLLVGAAYPMRATRIRSAVARHEDAMKDRNDSRDISPRIGSPLWIYLTVVTAAGAAVLGAALWLLTVPGLVALLRQPLLWVVAVLALVGQLRPIVTPGKSDPESGDASLTFSFAAPLYLG